jgi:predicted dehydrogenase
MGSTIDDEHFGQPHYPWPWAHAPAMIEAAGVDLVAGADLDPARLADFGKRWGVKALYTDLHEMVAAEKPDIVSVTTRPEERPEVVIALAEAGVKVIFATKPLCRTLAEADAMIDACRQNGVIFAVACHLNWYAPYTAARQLIARGEIGPLRSVVSSCPKSLSNIHSHILSLIRVFVGAPARWVFGHMDDEADAASERDLSGTGYVFYENGVQAILNSHSPDRSWDMQFNCERGRVVSRNRHAWFELWEQDAETPDLFQRQFPFPWRPRSSMVDAIEGVARSIEAGEETTCPGEFGREALEIVIAMRESHRRGGVRIDLPVADRSLRLGIRR